MQLIPPHNIEAEEAIIGGILVDNAAIARVGDLEPEHFYVQAHQKIWKAIKHLSAEDVPTDLIHVCQAFTDEEFNRIGGVVKLTTLMDCTLSAVNVDRYAALVKQKWQRRQLIKSCQELIAQSYDQTVEWEAIKTDADNKLTACIADTTNARGLRHIGEFIPEIWNELESGKNPATPTGLNYLDQCLGGGIRGGELIVLAARPSMGKTFVAQFLARLVADQAPVAFFSCEMDAKSIVKRFWATEAGIAQTCLTANAIAPNQADALVEGLSALNTRPIYIDDTPGSLVTVPYLQSECHRLYRQHNSLGLVVVDYLQLIGDQGSANRVGELGRYSSALKSLAKQFNCPVIALSQLSRGVESRNDKRPVMSDIRSSGAIEQDADVILMLYRDEYYNQNTDDAGILELIVAKNRHGASGVTAKANFDPSVGTITNFVNYSMDY